MTKEERRNHWRDIIDEKRASGLSGAVFCREHGLVLSTFYYWSRRLRMDATATEGFVQLIPEFPDNPASRTTKNLIRFLQMVLRVNPLSMFARNLKERATITCPVCGSVMKIILTKISKPPNSQAACLS